MPVNGILEIVSSERKVVVKPTDPEFMVLEIVIENIDADSKYQGQKVDAGTKIGKTTTARPCKSRTLDIKVILPPFMISFLLNTNIGAMGYNAY